MSGKKLCKVPLDKFRGTVTLKGFNNGGEATFNIGFKGLKVGESL